MSPSHLCLRRARRVRFLLPFLFRLVLLPPSSCTVAMSVDGMSKSSKILFIAPCAESISFPTVT